MLNTPPHLEARDPRGFVSIFHGTSSSVARRRLRASDLSFWQSMPSFYMNAPDCICSPGRLPLGAFCAGRDDLEREALHDDRISIHAPRVGRDVQADDPQLLALISIHAPRVGRDIDVENANILFEFQSTRPVWGATTSSIACDNRLIISIHAPRVGRDQISGAPDNILFISIHAPRVGRDLYRSSATVADRISIHAPRVGRDRR